MCLQVSLAYLTFKLSISYVPSKPKFRGLAAAVEALVSGSQVNRCAITKLPMGSPGLWSKSSSSSNMPLDVCLHKALVALNSNMLGESYPCLIKLVGFPSQPIAFQLHCSKQCSRSIEGNSELLERTLPTTEVDGKWCKTHS